MPVQDIDLDGQWTLDQPDQTWTLTANATITSEDDYGIRDATTGSDIRVMGQVFGDGGYAAVVLGSPTSTVTADAARWLSGFVAGIGIHQNGTNVVNHGYITGAIGVGGKGAVLDNFGVIQGEQAVNFNSDFALGNHGTIQGSTYGLIAGGTGGTIANAAGAQIIGEDGIGQIDAGKVRNQRDFNDLEIRQTKDGVVIDFGHDDKFMLLDVLKADLSYADFAAVA